MSSVSVASCITITTLAIISLVNLTLLVTLITGSLRNCKQQTYEVSKNIQIAPQSNKKWPNHKSIPSDQHQFLAALVIQKPESYKLMCGITIVSKLWALTAAHCCDSVDSYLPQMAMIMSNSATWHSGKAHEIVEIIKHENYNSKTILNNLCLIRVKQPFMEHSEMPVTLAGARYKYIANTTAASVGWMTQDDNQFYKIEMKLLLYSSCKKKMKKVVDESMVCAENIGDISSCTYDSGGPLIQKNIVIGMASSITDCRSGKVPKIYTRISFFQNWIRQIEKMKNDRLGIKFNA